MSDSFEIRNAKFQVDKMSLINDIDNALTRDPNNWPLQSARRILSIKNSTLDLNDFFRRLVKDNADRIPREISDKLIAFESGHVHYSDNLISKELKQFAEKLIDEGYKVTDYGMYWSNMTKSWLYVDKCFDLELQKEKMNFSKNIEVTEHLDKFGGFRGFYDKTTDEAVVCTISNLT